MADFNQLRDELKNALIAQGSKEWGKYRDAAARDGEAFLEKSRADLERWAGMLQSGQLSRNELEWLLKAKRDLVQMEALKQAGLSKVALDGFGNDLLTTLSQVVPRWAGSA